ncbi:hypothetical protein Dsin_017349 [Dipteronia sinensis]|uniref:Transmembrane protein n=1 Tax=Dipteronia sinensis TaxID=43782 RepID=A0AAE0AFJ4_9ROSI|nr:hypothetical protein Dsin_017349 [Dipteronia sinensis]
MQVNLRNNFDELDQESNEKKFEEVRKIIAEQETRLQNLQSTGFQLANYYFVFQGVILTASCNGSTSLKCSDRWFLFTVSLLAAVLNLVALLIIGLKYNRTIEQQDKNWCESNEIARRLLIKANNKTTTSKNMSREIQCVDPYRKTKRFAAVTLYGCWRFVCKRDESGNQLTEGGRGSYSKCIRFCNGGSGCLRICNEY